MLCCKTRSTSLNRSWRSELEDYPCVTIEVATLFGRQHVEIMFLMWLSSSIATVLASCHMAVRKHAVRFVNHAIVWTTVACDVIWVVELPHKIIKKMNSTCIIMISWYKKPKILWNENWLDNPTDKFDLWEGWFPKTIFKQNPTNTEENREKEKTNSYH